MIRSAVGRPRPCRTYSHRKCVRLGESTALSYRLEILVTGCSIFFDRSRADPLTASFKPERISFQFGRAPIVRAPPRAVLDPALRAAMRERQQQFPRSLMRRRRSEGARVAWFSATVCSGIDVGTPVHPRPKTQGDPPYPTGCQPAHASSDLLGQSDSKDRLPGNHRSQKSDPRSPLGTPEGWSP